MERDCLLECGTNSAAIIHYKEEHASNAILCYICDRPIYAKQPKDFQIHYDTTHPDADMPFIFNSMKKTNVKKPEAGIHKVIMSMLFEIVSF